MVAWEVERLGYTASIAATIALVPMQGTHQDQGEVVRGHVRQLRVQAGPQLPLREEPGGLVRREGSHLGYHVHPHVLGLQRKKARNVHSSNKTLPLSDGQLSCWIGSTCARTLIHIGT